MVPQLSELFGALAVGILATISLVAFFWIFDRLRQALADVSDAASISPVSSSAFMKRIASSPMAALAVLVIWFLGIGHLVQDITDHLTDSLSHSRYQTFWWPPYMQANVLRRESDHRFDSLFQIDVKNGDNCLKKTTVTTNPLGRDVFTYRRYYERVFENRGLTNEEKEFLEHTDAFLNERMGRRGTRELPSTFFKSRVKNGDSEETKQTKREIQAAKNMVNRIYYLAKNWCYDNTNYYGELRSIQQRIDFSRSCFLTASWFLILAALGFPLDWLAGLSRHSQDRSQKKHLAVPPAPKARSKTAFTVEFLLPPKTWRKLLIVALPYVLICWFARMGYRHAESMFNERTFGYFTTHLDLESHYSSGMPALSAKPPAVVLDLDETVLDNSPYQAHLVQDNRKFDAKSWKAWVRDHGNDVSLVPGARRFVRAADRLGCAVIYISNRPESERDATLRTLHRLDVDVQKELHLMVEDHSSKVVRRGDVERRYHVIAYIGDTLGDFPLNFEWDKSALERAESRLKTALEEGRAAEVDAARQSLQSTLHNQIVARRLAIDEFRDRWGSSWFILPNPVYGGWRTKTIETYPRSQLRLPSGSQRPSRAIPLRPDESLTGLLWMQTAAEYDAVCEQTYDAALHHIRREMRARQPFSSN